MTISTPAVLFGAIALIMLAQTNRFFVLANLIRDMHKNQDYTKRDLEAAKIKLYLDKIIAIRAAYYLEAAAEIIANRDARPDAFHDLSEGYGFVLSLQFTDFFTNAEVEVLLNQLLEGDGFWKVESNTLNTMAQQIRTKSNI